MTTQMATTATVTQNDCSARSLLPKPGSTSGL